MEPDAETAESLASRLRAEGHEVELDARKQFPIADALAGLLSQVSPNLDVLVAIILTGDEGRERWVVNEVLQQCHIDPGQRLRGAIFGTSVPPRIPAVPSFRMFDRDEAEQFLSFVSNKS